MIRSVTTRLFSLGISSIASIVATFITTSWFAPATAQAQANYQLGTPVLRGPGCPSGSASAVISPDGSAISILFDRFTIQRAPGTYRPEKLKTHCAFNIPLKVAPGFILKATSVDYRGFTSLQYDARGMILTSGPILHPGYRRPNDNHISTLLPGGTQEIQVRHEIPQRHFNQCQPQNSIQFTTTIGISAPGYRGLPVLREHSNITLDSADMGLDDGPISIGVELVPCRG
ncbi:MAG: DUF4360 domain-containing protein [Bdellovibrionaceae bacterium]|nr:DUF4360 domain-containing protein [Pseudobdellovibrionaceae bacterium]